MIVSDIFCGKRYAVLGLARSGLATVRALVASGADVTAWDANADARAHVGDNVTLADPMAIDLAGFDAVIVSPGVPINTHPIAQKARNAGVPIIGDIELFAMARPSLPPHRVIGITGTNGKSTTTALIHHILKTAGKKVRMGGNIGLPILSQEPLPTGGIYVLELSSFQIDLTYGLDCDVAILLNITPDHLDRYDSFDAYCASKLRLLDMQSRDHDAIVAAKEPYVEHAVMQMETGAELTLWFHGSFETEFLEEQRDWPALQGPHNAQNAWSALMACLSLGLTPKQINRGLKTYPGLPHRMERVRELDGVLYVNDSKATNATSTAPALAAYPDIHWILGGLAKTKDLDACAPHFGNVRVAYTYGQDGPMLADVLRPHMAVVECGTLDQAVKTAANGACAGQTVILSPACASYDQFRDFEDRGDSFRCAVMALTPSGGE
jgi:UDP-N-acetylmuramoylalanine--D-glutamate ligase